MNLPSSLKLGLNEKPAIVGGEELVAMKKPRTIRLVLDLLGPWVQIVAAFLLVALWSHPVSWVISFFLVGGAQHALGLLTHEFGHVLIFPDNKRLNDFVATWFYAAPGGLPFRFYRERHWDHHRFVSTDDDSKKLYRRNYSRWNLVKEFFLGISGYDYAYQVLSVLLRHKKQRSSGSESKTYIADFVIVVVVQFAIAAAMISWGLWHYVFLWLLPLVTAASLFAKLRSSVEHLPLPEEQGDGKYYLGTAVPFIRSVNATWFERLFLTRINFHYHLEHHLWPAVSYQYLPKLHKKLYIEKQFIEPPGYLNVLKDLWLSPKKD